MMRCDEVSTVHWKTAFQIRRFTGSPPRDTLDADTATIATTI